MKANKKVLLGSAFLAAAVTLSGCEFFGEERTAKTTDLIGGGVMVEGEEFRCGSPFLNTGSCDKKLVPVNEVCENLACSFFLALNSDVSLTAQPFAGFEFTGWSGEECSDEISNVCQVTVEDSFSVQAQFSYVDGVHPFEAQLTVTDPRLRECALASGFRFNYSRSDELLSLQCVSRPIDNLEGISDFTALSELSLAGAISSDTQGVNELTRLPNLTSLRLTGSSIDDYQFLFDTEFPNLLSLSIGRDNRADNQVNDFAGMSRDNFPLLNRIFVFQKRETIQDISALIDMVTGDNAAPLSLQGNIERLLLGVPCSQIEAFRAGMGTIGGRIDTSQCRSDGD